ncbi:thermostable carboxypeptidase 1 [Halalkalicoccus paucihalophilus]|uniref:Thermostable carboxypeptidase 1 n=1 Tax=Halalkalicoccus paucihalophilus TaxID=1008153 RepID=A0A151AEL9_9EURY|nr:amidohydrolase [Halalkalicoccus paucihalophilus]KYH26030.1 thermostable carboxypeptidase 1 [Halalkalicoccus paucihalophilus]
MSRTIRDGMSECRRTFHRYPEPAWREFYTTSLLIDEIERVGVDELAVGREAMAPDERMAVPGDEKLEEWFERARAAGAREDVLEACEGGYTGCVAVLDRGEGPSIGLRVDIDALFIEEASDEGHLPAREGFRSEHEGLMHACGHDAHMTIGLAVLEAVKESDFSGTLTVFFQPAEEDGGGGRPMAEGPYTEGIEYLLCVHVGLDHPTGEVVAGIEKPLAMSHIHVDFSGKSSHAGQAPEKGANAIQAMATAVSEAYAIPRHAGGMTRVNVGRVEAGTTSNIIAENARISAEVRGETTRLMESMKERFERICASAAEMHGCEADLQVHSESPRADSDPELAALVDGVARGVEGVDRPVEAADFGASEDATFLMEAVQEAGGLATYTIVGTDHPDSHHTPHFDVDERTLGIALDVLTGSIERIEAERP